MTTISPNDDILSRIEIREGGGMSFVGPGAVQVYAATVIASALRFYAKTGMKMNRSYTPKNMLAKATEITGKKFKARDYLLAADELQAWARVAAIPMRSPPPEASPPLFATVAPPIDAPVKKYRVTLSRVVHDTLAVDVVVEAANPEEAGIKALAVVVDAENTDPWVDAKVYCGDSDAPEVTNCREEE